MKKPSLSIKITAVFVFISFLTVASLYVIFSSLFEEYMLRTETEKVTLIAETIEPSVAMNSYLGLIEEIDILAKQVSSRKNVLGGTFVINDKILWEKSYIGNLSHFHIQYPIKDPVTADKIGIIDISYSKEEFDRTVADMRYKVFMYLAAMSILFLIFALLVQYLLNPLSLIAQKVKLYKLGDTLDFSSIRMEPETQAISDAFGLMVSNIREYTVLLEQYKLSVDESSIVSKMTPDGLTTYVNDEFVRVCGYRREELLNTTCYSLSGSAADKSVYDEIWKILQDKRIWKGVLKNITKSGQDYYVKTTIVPLLDEHGELLEFISIQQDITQIVEQQEQIQRQITDNVTGLPNRIKLSEDTAAMESILFAIISLDNYDIIKNYYSNETSLLTLKNLAKILTELLEPQNISVYKLVGGEFALLATKRIDIDWFKQICRFIIEKIEDHSLDINNNFIDLNVSIGFTSCKEKYLSHAGLALRHATENRKELIYYEDQENLIAQYENNISWTTKIKSALSEDRIILYAQPLVDARTMQITKYECLVRLLDEEGNIISPFYFLDVAKKTKLYHSITRQVITTAFEVFKQVPDMEFSINLSAEDILHKDTVNYLESIIVETGIGSRVVLEIVETEGIESFKQVTEFIYKMKALGCKIAIDDFGTGYSNFSYLMQLNVDHIKVDGSLIKDIDHNPNSQIICSTILNFSSALEISSVAEFVHSKAVLDHVKKLGFDYLQGYYLGEPEPIENLLND